MNTYHKIQTIFLRDPETKYRTLLEGQFAKPEFMYLANNPWVFTEKVDGTNIRVIWDGGGLRFAGKTDRAQLPKPLHERLREIFMPRLDDFAKNFSNGVCLYGEGYGAKIQKGGGNYRPDQDFVLFDVKIAHWWLQRDDVEDVAERFGLDTVPIIGQGTLFNAVDMTRAGFNSVWGDFLAEGIVARPKTELLDRGGRRIIAKIKHRDFPR